MKPLSIVAGSIVTIVLLVSSGRAERVGITEAWVDAVRGDSRRCVLATGGHTSVYEMSLLEGDKWKS